jgi:hypothetical protein
MIWLYCLAVLISIFLWNVIHELSHVIAAKLFGNVKSWKIKPYPHMHEGNFRFAGAYWDWEDARPANGLLGLISLAPRVANFIGVQLVLAVLLTTGLPQMLLAIFCGVGMIDLIYGSIGWSDSSDLKKAAERLEISPWTIRLPGLGYALIGAVGILMALI